MKDVLILLSYAKNKIRPNYDDTMLALKKYENEEYKLYRGAIKDLEFKITEGTVSAKDSITRRDISSFDLVFFRLWQREHERARAAATYLDNKNVPFFDTEVLSPLSLTKITDMVMLAGAKLPVPDTYISSPKQTARYLEDSNNFTYPLIIKDVNGTRGSNNYMAKSLDQAKDLLKLNPTIHFMLQQYVPNNCDYRFLVCGNKIDLVIRRQRKNNSTHLNNTSTGASGEVVPLSKFSEKIKTDVLLAASLHNREFCGVDVIIDKNSSKHYILEVNAAPDLASGAAISDKIAALDSLIRYKLSERAA